MAMSTRSQFKVGDLVMLVPGQMFYEQAPGLRGRINRGSSDSWWVVFENGYTNVYINDSLQKVQDGVTAQETYSFLPPYESATIFVDQAQSQKKVTKKKAVVKKEKKGVSFESVIIAEDKKKQILAAISQIDNSTTIFEKWGFGDIFEKGTAVSLLFDGGPGTGKTLMAEAIANKIERPLIIVGAAEIESPTPGEAERNIKRYFKMAGGHRGRPTGEVEPNGEPKLHPAEKCVLLFDECDSLITNRAHVGMIMRSQINTLLTELERFDGVVIFTTNRKEDLDPAMERRITEKIVFGFPDKKSRELIWKRMIPKKCPIDKSVDFEKLSEFPIAGGNIKNVVLNAARRAAFAKHKEITYEDFYDAIEAEMKGMQSFEAAMKKGRGAHATTRKAPEITRKAESVEISGN